MTDADLRTPSLRLPAGSGPWLRSRLRPSYRGLLIAFSSQLLAIPLFVVGVLSIAYMGLGIGIAAVPLVMSGVRAYAELQRRCAREWSGVDIPSPYRPQPEFARDLIGLWRRCRWLLTDPATWRDLLWLLLNAPVGLALGLLPAGLLVYALEGVLVAPWLGHVTWYGYGAIWPIDGLLDSVLVIVQGAILLPLGLAAGPWIIKGHALFTRWLLGPTRKAQLAVRVHRLTETRSDAVDASAAELRRIERDLHDGAQARLAALGMSLGMAEDLLKTDPEAAQQLLFEARKASGQALAELRDLVRGIHPPVLVERGLDGAVRALALSLPVPVDVTIELPGRPQAPVESAAYFAIAEALANVVKHSEAARALVQLHHAKGRLVMLVGDDGIGGADPGGGSGLRGIERRLGAFDGTIAVTSPPGGPTAVTMELPCELSSPKIWPSSETG
ncbi:sensor histidine kinase [Actinomadura alba]|uniref:histidine kinase n=1 Tax=Actinomadura alba TaxID=406431 RepID=A0ABR7LPG9_9ACTN|nr:sensor histidine kinase [Actinomadura alba]MBC6466390.1 sensor domain-containing protein [Actinomadura alba]